MVSLCISCSYLSRDCTFQIPIATLRKHQLVCLLSFWLTALVLSRCGCVTIDAVYGNVCARIFSSPFALLNPKKEEKVKKDFFPAWHKCAAKIHSNFFYLLFFPFRYFFLFSPTFDGGWKVVARWFWKKEVRLRENALSTFDIKTKSVLRKIILHLHFISITSQISFNF